MFSYETDLTLDSIMVGKQTTVIENERLNRKNITLFDDSRRTSSNLVVPMTHPETPTSTMYMLFGRDHNTLTQMYADMFEDDDLLRCYRCGDNLNIFNCTSHSLCKYCDEAIQPHQKGIYE